MIEIKNKQECCGCTACYAVCPVNCIKMEEDSEGFTYPKADAELCISCGLCDKVCPIKHSSPHKEYVRTSRIVRAKDTAVVKKSTSGGFITPLYNWVIQRGGYFCAAAYVDDFRVKHIIDHRGDKINAIRGSKYVQSALGDTYKDIVRLLKEGNLVVFVGTPCQVAGLKSLTGERKNMITIDVVCRGVGSPLFYGKYTNWLKRKEGSEISSISFRNKTYGYYGSTMKVMYKNGKTYTGMPKVDDMLIAYYTGLCSRPSCYNCVFKMVERCSDLTIFDAWSAGKLNAQIKDADKGYTNVIIQSPKGKQVWDNIKDDYFYYDSDITKCVALDGIMIEKSDIENVNRDNFFKDLCILDYESVRKKYLIPTNEKKIRMKIAQLLYITRLMKIYRIVMSWRKR